MPKDFNIALKMYSEGYSIAYIASYFGISRQSMWKSLRRRGCEFRPHIKRGKDSHFYRESDCDEEAFAMVRSAIRNGLLERKPCEVCGNNPVASDGRSLIHAHHVDYNKPLEVTWLCQKHHFEWHKANKAIPRSSAKTPRWRTKQSSSVV